MATPSAQSPVSVDTTIDDRIRVIPARYVVPYKKSVSSLVILGAVVGVLFVITVGVAVWYYTAPLRELPRGMTSVADNTQPSAPATPLANTPTPPTSEPSQSPSTSEAPTPSDQPASPQPATPPAVLALAQDTDGDGLTDREEILLGTQVLNPDSDGDGYIDGSEVGNLFSPLSPAGKKLSDEKSLFGLVTMQAPAVSFLAPLSWRVAQTPAGMTLRISDTESITITTTGNVFGISLRDWINNQPDKKDSAYTDIETKNGLTGLRGNNGASNLFLIGNTVLDIEYRVATGAPMTFSYPSLVKVMLDTLKN